MNDSVRDSLLADLRELGATEAESERVLGDLAGLRVLGGPAPSPSAALAALMAPAAPGPEQSGDRVAQLDAARRRAVRRSGAVSSVLVLAVSGVGATGISAVANTLPAPLQHQVADFSRDHLPFELPRPTGADRVVGGTTLHADPDAAGETDRGSLPGTSQDGSTPPGGPDPAAVLGVDAGPRAVVVDREGFAASPAQADPSPAGPGRAQDPGRDRAQDPGQQSGQAGSTAAKDTAPRSRGEDRARPGRPTSTSGGDAPAPAPVSTPPRPGTTPPGPGAAGPQGLDRPVSGPEPIGRPSSDGAPSLGHFGAAGAPGAAEARHDPGRPSDPEEAGVIEAPSGAESPGEPGLGDEPEVPGERGGSRGAGDPDEAAGSGGEGEGPRG